MREEVDAAGADRLDTDVNGRARITDLQAVISRTYPRGSTRHHRKLRLQISPFLSVTRGVTGVSRVSQLRAACSW